MDATESRPADAVTSDAMVRSVAEVAPNILYVYDVVEGRNVWANRALTSVLGYTPEDLAQLGAPLLPQIMHPEDMAGFHEHHQRLMALCDGEVAEFTYRMQCRDGRWVWLASRDMVFRRSAAGEVQQIVGSALDVTTEREALETLRESEDRFRTMTDGLPLIVWVHDAAGHLQLINRTYCELYNVTLEQVRGGGWQLLTHPEDTAAYAGEFAACVQARRPFHAEVRVKNAAGEWRWLESWAQPRFSGTGTFLGFVGASADITERKALEAALAAAKERAELAARAKDRFLATLSHELRTPLTPVLMMAGVHRQDETLPPEVREDFEMIERNVAMEVRLVDDLLDLSRINAGKFHFQMRPCPFEPCIATAVRLVRVEAEARQIVLAVEPVDPGWTIQGDCDRLVQLVCNLLRNAVKFSPAHSLVRIRTGMEGGSLCLSVSDCGRGIPPDQLERIFRPFEQVEMDGQRQHGGLGMGLAICSAIAAAHGGRIWAESEGLGHGATFHVRLPLLT